MTQIAPKTVQGTARTRTQTGLAAGTRVMTLDGQIAVEFLQPGDRIITRQGVRPLRGIHMVEREGVEAVTIKASALGHDRPEEDITMAADQPLLLRDWRAQALYGADQAIIPAKRLADGEYIAAKTTANLRTFALVFDTPQVIYAEGCELPMETTVEMVD
ncbi:hypothetical protein PARPLA_02836 [Rhodobacteraceae bacterium THAF1]|uniref:Hint domain-containing protein n=1 Tax=Palleronia sp. THAF1 TaxID=2587842 RepID=UPI000F3DDE96|nr:Hint domain-containing protein [Palleronia sp. THAF1]QFU08239.1 hypothetical protein FIU81_06090 [Palleronia sp. THAF1]VDC28795.1 hypothetical protein PARPLA_02836 [Rhodobacteraceae bacterium THAF1]